ncbi:MAG: helix-turn-helix domain-containing protein [Bacteroidota bacterium]
MDEQRIKKLVDNLITELEERFGKQESNWIHDTEAMKILGIRSKTTLQKLRQSDAIRYSQPSRGIIMYCRESLEAYMSEHANH